jgi:hypothetical protein
MIIQTSILPFKVQGYEYKNNPWKMVERRTKILV